MNIYLTLISICFILQGCISAMVISTAAIATKTIHDPRTIGTQIDDDTLAIKITKIFAKDQELKKNTHINIIVYQRKVLLTGQSPSIKFIERAKHIILGIHGILGIYNEVRQGPLVSLKQRSMDIWITTKIRSQLFASMYIKSSKFKITTENGEVFLLGIVTNDEAKIATKIANKTHGVKCITTIFNYFQ